MSAATAEVIQMSTSIPTVGIETITSEQAVRYLDGNVRNRSIRQATVSKYARDMADGNWHLTGESIKFATDGTLLDGQHRLWAVIDAAVPVDMLVVRGVENGAQDVMDSGLKRTASDALGLAGYSNRTLLASVGNLGIALENGINARTGGLGRAGDNSHAEILAWVDAHPEVADVCARTASRYAGKIDAPPTSLAYALWQLSALNPEAADEFFEGMATLSTSGERDPRYVAMRFFMRAKRDRVRLSHTVALSVIYRSWNAWRKGKKVASIRTEVDGKVIAIPTPLP